jgi:hypothetical protein
VQRLRENLSIQTFGPSGNTLHESEWREQALNRRVASHEYSKDKFRQALTSQMTIVIRNQ